MGGSEVGERCKLWDGDTFRSSTPLSVAIAISATRERNISASASLSLITHTKSTLPLVVLPNPTFHVRTGIVPSVLFTAGCCCTGPHNSRTGPSWFHLTSLGTFSTYKTADVIVGCRVSGDCSSIVRSACVFVGGRRWLQRGGCHRPAARGSASEAPTTRNTRPWRVLRTVQTPQALGALRIGRKAGILERKEVPQLQLSKAFKNHNSRPERRKPLIETMR